MHPNKQKVSESLGRLTGCKLGDWVEAAKAGSWSPYEGEGGTANNGAPRSTEESPPEGRPRLADKSYNDNKIYI